MGLSRDPCQTPVPRRVEHSHRAAYFFPTGSQKIGTPKWCWHADLGRVLLPPVMGEFRALGCHEPWAWRPDSQSLLSCGASWWLVSFILFCAAVPGNQPTLHYMSGSESCGHACLLQRFQGCCSIIPTGHSNWIQEIQYLIDVLTSALLGWLWLMPDKGQAFLAYRSRQ